MSSSTDRLRRALVLWGLTAPCLACGESPLTPTAEPVGTLSMTVDGERWTALEVTATTSDGFVVTTAVDVDGAGMGLELLAFAFEAAGPGRYLIRAGTPTNATYARGTRGWLASGVGGGSGVIDVTTLDDERVAGTFSFEVRALGEEARASVRITGGIFDIPF